MFVSGCWGGRWRGHTSKVGAKDPGVVQEWQLLMVTEHVPDPVLGAVQVSS